VGFNFAPAGWAFCQGQLLPISENEVLFNLIGTTYGGDGQSTFGLPDLRGRVPIHQGSNFVMAQIGGVEQVTLNTQQLPIHSHPLFASGNNGNTNLAQNNVLAASPTKIYVANSPNPNRAMNNLAITSTGSSQVHNNLQPYLAMNWIISLYGVFPSPT
jgi:microcystin-dependent protein